MMYDLMSTPHIITTIMGRRFIDLFLQSATIPLTRINISLTVLSLFVICHFSERVFGILCFVFGRPFPAHAGRTWSFLDLPYILHLRRVSLDEHFIDGQQASRLRGRHTRFLSFVFHLSFQGRKVLASRRMGGAACRLLLFFLVIIFGSVSPKLALSVSWIFWGGGGKRHITHLRC